MSTSPDDAQIKAAILGLIVKRGAHSSACPSEVARALSGNDWRALMPRVRQVAWQLMRLGALEITQGSVPIAGLDLLVGPIRIRLAKALPDGNPGQKTLYF